MPPLMGHEIQLQNVHKEHHVKKHCALKLFTKYTILSEVRNHYISGRKMRFRISIHIYIYTLSSIFEVLSFNTHIV